MHYCLWSVLNLLSKQENCQIYSVPSLCLQEFTCHPVVVCSALRHYWVPNLEFLEVKMTFVMILLDTFISASLYFSNIFLSLSHICTSWWDALKNFCYCSIWMYLGMGKKVEEELRWSRNVYELLEKGIATNKESVRGVWEAQVARRVRGDSTGTWNWINGAGEVLGKRDLDEGKGPLCHILGLPLSHSCKRRSQPQPHCSHKPRRLLPPAGHSPCLAPCTWPISAQHWAKRQKWLQIGSPFALISILNLQV